ARVDRQGAGHDRAGDDHHPRPAARLGDAVGARPGVRLVLEDEILMADRRLLYVTAEDHYLYRAARGGLELERRLSGDDLALTAFREHLLSRPGGLFSVVADLAGEDFHEEQIPFLRGNDREAIVQRRLAQRYRDTRLATAISLGEA